MITQYTNERRKQMLLQRKNFDPYSMALSSPSPSEPVPDTAGSETRVMHTPQNSTVTSDSTSATLDSISPRNRDEIKGCELPISMTAGGSDHEDLDTDNASVRVQNREHSPSPDTLDSPESLPESAGSNSAASPPSPLSVANNDRNDALDEHQVVPHHQFDLDTAPIDDAEHLAFRSRGHLRVNGTANEKQQRMDEYKVKLEELDALSSPTSLFQDIDTMISDYKKLKKEYCLQWELQQMYRQQIRSLVKQTNTKNGSVPNLDTNDHHLLHSSIPLHEVGSLISRLQHVQHSVQQMFPKLIAKPPPPPKPVKSRSPRVSTASKRAHHHHHRQATLNLRIDKNGYARHSHHGGHSPSSNHHTHPPHSSSSYKKHSHSHRHSKNKNNNNFNHHNNHNNNNNMHHSRSITMKIQHIESRHNIRPSHAKQLSNGHMNSHDLSNISQTLIKERRDAKHKRHRHKHVQSAQTHHHHRHHHNKTPQQHRHVKTPQLTASSPSASPSVTPKLRRTKSAADYDYSQIIGFNHDTLYQRDESRPLLMLQVPSDNHSKCPSTPKSKASSSKHNTRSNREAFSQSTAPSSPRDCTRRRKHRDRDRRRSSVRSFGTVYSHQFRQHVAKNYRCSIRMHHDEKPHPLQLASASPSQMKLVKFYRNDYIGHNELFESPFGIRPVLYCDWAASGKSLRCVEKYIKEEMLTLYAETHTATSITGTQTSKYRSEARSIILESLHGDAEQDVVIFCGTSSTAAIYKMANVLMKSTDKSFRPETTIVFVSVYEHNSNIFIWKELGCKIVVISEQRKRSGIDLKALEKQLKFYTCSPMKFKYTLLIGSFTAASNVSGIINPIDRTTELLHKYGALAFWDYSAAGPYHQIKMTNTKNPALSKDAVFLSMHQWLGGPGSPGILCAKKRLFQNYIPVVPGEGTLFVAYGVEDGEWEYLENIEEREEAGVPDIIGSVRACFAFMVKDHISTDFIQQRDRQCLDYFLTECKTINNLVIMGNTDCSRLPTISFLITHTKRGFGASQKTKYLHYNFIAALMNDLFGIQGRGGCGGAGMYGKHVLGISSKEVDHVIEQMREHQNELARPGFFRIHLHYTLTDEELEYIVNAVKYVCRKGWLFVPLYEVDPETGSYLHRDIKKKPQILQRYRSLLDVTFDKKKGEMFWTKKHLRINNRSLKGNFSRFFEMADNVIENMHKHLPSHDHQPFANEQGIQDDAAWYWLPSELYQDARNYTL